MDVCAIGGGVELKTSVDEPIFSRYVAIAFPEKEHVINAPLMSNLFGDTHGTISRVWREAELCGVVTPQTLLLKVKVQNTSFDILRGDNAGESDILECLGGGSDGESLEVEVTSHPYSQYVQKHADMLERTSEVSYLGLRMSVFFVDAEYRCRAERKAWQLHEGIDVFCMARMYEIVHDETLTIMVSGQGCVEVLLRDGPEKWNDHLEDIAANLAETDSLQDCPISALFVFAGEPMPKRHPSSKQTLRDVRLPTPVIVTCPDGSEHKSDFKQYMEPSTFLEYIKSLDAHDPFFTEVKTHVWLNGIAYSMHERSWKRDFDNMTQGLLRMPEKVEIRVKYGHFE